jgi:hypothetical protein
MKIIDINGTEREAQKVYPDPTYPGFMRVEFRRHHEWYSLAEFLEFNPTLKNLTENAPATPTEVVGVVTSSHPANLVDKSQKWLPNAYLGMFVWISRGKGEGQKRTIIKNDSTRLYLDKPWDIKPNTSSQYVISYNVQDVKNMGNVLPSENMKDLEKKALKLDKQRGKLTSDLLKKNYKYLKPEEM